MRTDIGTWKASKDGHAVLTAKPKAYNGVLMPDSDDPDAQEIIYVRYKVNGKVDAMPLWKAQDFLISYPLLYEVTDQAAYSESEAAILKRELEVVIAPELEAQMKTGNEDILEALQSQGEKIDKLADAILALAKAQSSSAGKAGV